MQTLSAGNLAGAALAGTFASLMLYGISVLQTFIYFVRYRTDKIYLKLLVTVIFLLDTIHQFLLCVNVWNGLIQNFGNYSQMYAISGIFFVLIMITVVVSTIIQLFFVYRIWFLSSGYFRYLFPMSIIPFIIAQPFATTYYVVKAWKITDIQGLSNSLLLVVVIGVVIAGTAAIDVTITLAMCILLWQGRTRINANTDHILVHLIIISINTGFWMAVVSIIAVVAFLTLQNEFVYVGLYDPLSTLYCNTLLANLNVWSYVRNVDDYVIPSIHIARQSNMEAEEIVFGHVGAKPDNA